MPNPLSSVKPDAQIEMGPYAFFERPHLAVYVMATIAHWSEIELLKADLLARLIGSRKPVGLALYLAVKSPTAQRALMDAAIDECLQPKDRPLYAAVMKAISGSDKRRNQFAHHLWGFSPDLPDALLLVDNKSALSFERALIEHDAGRVQIEPSWPEFDLSEVMVYTEGDLEQSVNDASDAEEWMYHLRNVFIWVEAEQSRQVLAAEPRIQQFLRPPSTQTPPEAQPQEPTQVHTIPPSE